MNKKPEEQINQSEINYVIDWLKNRTNKKFWFNRFSSTACDNIRYYEKKVVTVGNFEKAKKIHNMVKSQEKTERKKLRKNNDPAASDSSESE